MATAQRGVAPRGFTHAPDRRRSGSAWSGVSVRIIDDVCIGNTRTQALLGFGRLRLEQNARLAGQPFVERTEGAGIRLPIEFEKRTVGFV